MLSRKGKSRKRPVFESRTNKNSEKLGHHLSRLVVFLVLLVLISLVQFQFKFGTYRDLTLQEGGIAQEDIVAEFEFQVPRDAAETARDRSIAEKRVLPVVKYNEDVTKAQVEAVDNFFQQLRDIQKENIAYEEKVAKVVGWGMNLSQISIDVLLNSEKERRLHQHVKHILKNLYEKGIIADKRILEKFSSNVIHLQRDDTEIQVPVDSIYDENQALEHVVAIGRSLANNKMDTISVAFYEITSKFIIHNLRFNASETERRIAEAINGVPTIEKTVFRDEKIIGKHERVNDETYAILQAYLARKQELQKENIWEIYLVRGGQVLFSMLILGVMGFYLQQYRVKIYADISKIILLSILIAVVAATSLFSIPQANVLPLLIPVTVASMLITILFDSELGIIYTILIGLLLGTFPERDIYTIVTAVVAGVAASHSVRRVRHRHQFYRSMLLISLAYIISVVATDMIRIMPPDRILQDCFWGIINGVVSTILTIGLLPVFESIFHVTTDITLLELGDFQRPLLKKLALEAPGTHSHSLAVGNLSEAAAEAIGANALLCRVGCYYHDIGKTVKPAYFIENQRGHNPHDGLSPNMSTLIIISHVKEGIDMAKKAGLPQCIIDFIPEHHGTSLVSFFYNKALEQGDTVNEYDFRYPGPKPQSKETAIVMIADSVESASRVLKEPNANRLTDLINKIINNKFIAGQFDECDLTFKELTKIGEAFLPLLVAIYHSRIDYPETKKTKDSKNVDLYKSSTTKNKSDAVDETTQGTSEK